MSSVITYSAAEQLRYAILTLNDTQAGFSGKGTGCHYVLTIRYCDAALSIIRYRGAVRARHPISVGQVKGEAGREVVRPLVSRPHTPTERLDTLSRHTSKTHYRPLAFRTFSCVFSSPPRLVGTCFDKICTLFESLFGVKWFMVWCIYSTNRW